MNLNEEVEVLKGVPIFAKMEPAKLKLLAFTGERMTFGAGQEVCHQGDLGGAADVLLDTEKGQIRVAEIKKNGFFGETAILLAAPRNATIKASESLLTLKISKDMFYSLVADVPQMAIEVMRELAHRVEETNKKLSEATAKLAA